MQTTLNVGTTLQNGKYKIVRFISSGGFGCTYEAVHTGFGTRVAIKEFFVQDFCNRDEESNISVATQSKLGLFDKLRKKFIDEAKALHNMRHDGIVHVSDVFEENGTAYYVMDFIEGQSLQDLVDLNGQFSEQQALTYILQVADALKYVHSKNRLHLDIKPGNIMIDKHGKAILIDFGASKHYDEATGENTSTLLGINTKGYAPLEQMTQNFSTFSAATDIYALGATLYKLLTGATPPDAIVVASGVFDKPELPASFSPSIRRAVSQSMLLKRNERPQTIDEFINLLLGNSAIEDFRSSTDNSDATVVVDNHGSHQNSAAQNPTVCDNPSQRAGATVCDAPQSETAPTRLDIQPPHNNPPSSPNYADSGSGNNGNNDNGNKGKNLKGIIIGAACLIAVVAVCLWLFTGNKDKSEGENEDGLKYYTDLSEIAIGDYLYSDGTYTHELDSANIDNCSGCVYNLTTTSSEQQDGWRHGHIVALKDAVNRAGETQFAWGPLNYVIPNYKDIASALNCKNGYNYCLLDSMYMSPALCSVYDIDGKVFDVPLPEGSKWYVPTPSDWQDIITNLGNTTIESYDDSLLTYDNEKVSPILQKKIGAFPRRTGKTLFDNDDYAYWTCIQQYMEGWDDQPRAWAVYATNEYGKIGNAPAGNKMSVRPVAAF